MGGGTEVGCIGNTHELMEFQKPGPYAIRDMGLTSKTEYMVVVHERRSQ